MREIAQQVGITDRAVQRLAGDLVEGGHLTRTRARRNEYRIDRSRVVQHPREQTTRLEAPLAPFVGR